jgi:pyridoxine kinase
MKRIATIQDFSCVGKCSLTAAIPVISAAGLECCGIPTALLSNHTGFPSFHIRDLTEELLPIGEQLKRLGITFDAIYTGYIATAEQMAIISDFIDEFRGENTLVFVDPVMGDNGRLYSALTADYPDKMRNLCAKADIILPNLTEACLLTGRDFINEPTAADFESILSELVGICAGKAVITGAVPEWDGGMTGALGFDGKEFIGEYTPREELACSGTGDIFASALLGAVMRGRSFADAVKIAVRFTYRSVKLTVSDPERRGYGVNFEEALPEYIRSLSE